MNKPREKSVSGLPIAQGSDIKNVHMEIEKERLTLKVWGGFW